MNIVYCFFDLDPHSIYEYYNKFLNRIMRSLPFSEKNLKDYASSFTVEIIFVKKVLCTSRIHSHWTIAKAKTILFFDVCL